jgi:hypothetical protein
LPSDVWAAKSRTIGSRGGKVIIHVIIDTQIYIPVCILIAHYINTVTKEGDRSKQAQQLVI